MIISFHNFNKCLQNWLERVKYCCDSHEAGCSASFLGWCKCWYWCWVLANIWYPLDTGCVASLSSWCKYRYWCWVLAVLQTLASCSNLLPKLFPFLQPSTLLHTYSTLVPISKYQNIKISKYQNIFHTLLHTYSTRTPHRFQYQKYPTPYIDLYNKKKNINISISL